MWGVVRWLKKTTKHHGAVAHFTRQYLTESRQQAEKKNKMGGSETFLH